MKKTVAIILNWNRADDTFACLESLRHQDCQDLQLLVVDNGSSDGSADLIHEVYPDIELLRNSENLGYAGGNNVGMGYTLQQGAEFLWVLNNDTLIDPGCVQTLVDHLRAHPEAAAVTPKVVHAHDPKLIYFAGGKITPEGRALHVGYGQLDSGEFDQAGDTEWVTGCSMMVRADVLRKIGLFEPRYFLLFEDCDWSLRARRQGGQLRYEPAARVRHKVSASFGTVWSPFYLYYYTRNALWWIERNFPWHQRPFLWNSAILRSRQAAAGKKSGNARLLRRAVRLGVRDYLLRRMGRRDYPWAS